MGSGQGLCARKRYDCAGLVAAEGSTKGENVRQWEALAPWLHWRGLRAWWIYRAATWEDLAVRQARLYKRKDGDNHGGVRCAGGLVAPIEVRMDEDTRRGKGSWGWVCSGVRADQRGRC